jgi:hypothetical protein
MRATGSCVCYENTRSLQGTTAFGLFFRKRQSPQTRASAGISLRSERSICWVERFAIGLSFQVTVLALRGKPSMHAIDCCITIHALAEYRNQGDKPYNYCTSGAIHPCTCIQFPISVGVTVSSCIAGARPSPMCVPCAPSSKICSSTGIPAVLSAV